MRALTKVILIAAFIFILADCISAQTTLHVPAQYPTIRDAVDASVDGDIVLVAPGVYNEFEAILIENKGITVKSTNGADTTTIITNDGTNNNADFLFHLRSAENTYINGFTIKLTAPPVQTGGAFFIYATDSLIIEDIIIKDAQDGTAGCAIYIDDASPYFERVLIHNNTTTHPVGGVIRVEGQISYPKFENCTIVNNESSQRGIITLQAGNIEVINSILWSNSYPLIYFNGGAAAQSSASISYSDFEGGLSSIVTNNNGAVSWVEGNIDNDPMFIDPMISNYHLQFDSPCIDAGDPNSQNDPDGSRTDIGAFYFDQTVIPVELLSFTASVTRNTVTLNWTTATELNNYGFEIQRSKIENVWEKIVLLEGYGTTTETHNYSYVDANLTPGKYLYRLKQIDFNGQYEYSDVIEVELIPERYALFQNYPNPFNPSTKITFTIPELSFITIKVYDVLGNEIITLLNEEKPAGSYEIGIDGSELTSGIYFYKLQAGDFVETKKMILMK